jgi:hypothetical protein
VTDGERAPIFLQLSADRRRLHFNDLIYVFGGEVIGEESRMINEVWIYSPNLDDYAPIALMPTPWHDMAAVTHGDRIFFFAGGFESGFTPSTTNEYFIP